MNVVILVLRSVIIDNTLNLMNIETSTRHIGRYEYFAGHLRTLELLNRK